MNIGNNIETFITIASISLTFAASYFILRVDWKRFGLVFLLAGIVGNILCYIFVKLGLYLYPYRLFPKLSIMPFETILTIFPFFVILGIRYSPKNWAYKISFYMVIVHLGLLAETLAHNFTDLIHYTFEWDFWDSYTWWWIFLLIFEYIGGLIVPNHSRKPISPDAFGYGKWAWWILHFVVIITIFLWGYYLALKSL
jgi:hypothetical protein